MFYGLCVNDANNKVLEYGTILNVKGTKERNSEAQLINFKCQHGSVTVQLENGLPDKSDMMFSDCFNTHTKFSMLVSLFLLVIVNTEC